jgi:hypothetical protein
MPRAWRRAKAAGRLARRSPLALEAGGAAAMLLRAVGHGADKYRGGRGRTRSSCSAHRPDCLARVGELRNVVAKYPFESSSQISGDPVEFRPQRLFVFELRWWEAQLGPSARISAGCLRWQELPRFSADAEMIRRWPIQQYHCSLCAGFPRHGQQACRLALLSRQRQAAPPLQ